MTPEGRVERLERIAKLFVRAGRRARADLRQQDEKINILINLHMQNEELFARNEERFKKNEERFRLNEERFAKNEERFARNEERVTKQAEIILTILEFQKQTEEKFRANEKRFARTDKIFIELAESQVETRRNLKSLFKLIREVRNNNAED
jgi:hypothetical protein